MWLISILDVPDDEINALKNPTHNVPLRRCILLLSRHNGHHHDVYSTDTNVTNHVTTHDVFYTKVFRPVLNLS